MASAPSADIRINFLKAASSGDLALLEILVAKLGVGGEVPFDKIRDRKGRTALHCAAAAGKAHICEYLVKRLKLDVNAQDDEGATPLFFAILAQNLQIALCLMDNGASNTIAENRGCTPLHAAAMKGNKELLQLLISKGAEIEAISQVGTPLSFAASAGFAGAVEVLLQNNANPNHVANDVFAPILSSSCVSLECTDLLVKAGADLNVNLFGLTPLNAAVNAEKVDVTLYLLKAGANPNDVNEIGMTPLELAAINGNAILMSILFPVTTPIPSIPDWSIAGLMKYIASPEVCRKRNLGGQMDKLRGAEAFKRKDYMAAIRWYSKAMLVDRCDATLLSNRSLCYARLNEGKRALSDAKACISLRPDWPKAHYREGVAFRLLKDYDQATKSFCHALTLDPGNQEIQEALQETIEAGIAALGI